MNSPTTMGFRPRSSIRLILYVCAAVTFLSGLSAYWSLQGRQSSNTPIHPPAHGFQQPSSRPSGHVASTNLPTASPSKSPYIHLAPENLKGSDDVQVVFKTGATELYDKLPVHFVTTLTHVPNYLFFSDIDQIIGDYTVHDSLDEYNETMKEENKDFELYRKLQKFKPLRQDPKRLKLNGGWELDKYKNVHILAKTYKINPKSKWYIFIDADTYVVWPNLLRWLKTMDHEEPLYLGSPTMFKGLEFAHGGTGYIVSQGAMQKTVGKDPQIASKYETEAAESCCGDHVLGKSLSDKGVKLTKSWPKLNGEPPYLIPFTDEQWCQPIVTLHHMLPVDIQDMWEFERQNATAERPIIYADVFDHFIKPALIAERDAWDNQSNDWEYVSENEWDPKKHGDKEFKDLSETEKNAQSSFENCKKLCEKKDECYQFMLWKTTCSLSRKVKLGQKEVEGSVDSRKSGWLLDRIEGLRMSKNPCKREGW